MTESFLNVEGVKIKRDPCLALNWSGVPINSNLSKKLWMQDLALFFRFLGILTTHRFTVVSGLLLKISEFLNICNSEELEHFLFNISIWKFNDYNVVFRPTFFSSYKSFIDKKKMQC